MACSWSFRLSGIGFGTWAWGNQFVWGYEPGRDDLRLAATFHEAIASGLTLVDTADSYGTGRLNGRSELLLGGFVEELPPSLQARPVIATKLAPFPWRLGRRGLDRAFQASRRRQPQCCAARHQHHPAFHGTELARTLRGWQDLRSTGLYLHPCSQPRSCGCVVRCNCVVYRFRFQCTSTVPLTGRVFIAPTPRR